MGMRYTIRTLEGAVSFPFHSYEIQKWVENQWSKDYGLNAEFPLCYSLDYEHTLEVSHEVGLIDVVSRQINLKQPPT